MLDGRVDKFVRMYLVVAALAIAAALAVTGLDYFVQYGDGIGTVIIYRVDFFILLLAAAYVPPSVYFIWRLRSLLRLFAEYGGDISPYMERLSARRIAIAYLWVAAAVWFVKIAYAAWARLEHNASGQYCDYSASVESANYEIGGLLCLITPSFYFAHGLLLVILIGATQAPAYLYFLARYVQRRRRVRQFEAA